MLNKFLVTSALDESIINDRFDYVLLGKWCILHDKENFWSTKKYKIKPYHWDNRDKLKLDHDFLKLLYDKILNQLTFELNNLHNINKSKNYWTIIIGPWLSIYLPKMFDRWEVLDNLFKDDEKYVTVKIYNNNFNIPNDIFDCMKFYQSDEWNYNIFLDIIEKKYHGRVVFIDYHKNSSLRDQTKIFNAKNTKQKLITFFDTVIKKFTFNNKYFFYKSYFRSNKILYLNFILKQLPRMYINDFVFNYNKIQKRQTIKELNPFGLDTEFTEYLRKRIYQDIPFSYVENFNEIRHYTNSLNYNPDIIFTSNAHMDDEVFKIWAAEMVSNGKKLVLSHHGGAFPSLFCNLYHEEECSHVYTTWFKESNTKQIQLPPNKIPSIKKFKKGKFCSIIGYESTRYTYRAEAAPLSHQCILCFDQVISFCKLLDMNILNSLRIRPYENMGWNLKDRYINIFGFNCIDNNNYHTFLSNSKIIICTYPQTTFSEAMSSGKPTILLFKKELFELADISIELVNDLINSNIIFTNPQKAAKHINNIWNDVQGWWQCKEVIESRNKFHQIALNNNKNWNEEWLNFFKSLN